MRGSDEEGRHLAGPAADYEFRYVLVGRRPQNMAMQPAQATVTLQLGCQI